MKKALLALGVLLSLAIAILAGGVIYIASFDPNENKDRLAQKFAEATGRELTLGGDVGLTIYPWLGVTLNQAMISNAEGFSDTPMLDVDHAELRVKLLPLFWGEYVIDTVRLQGARINLETAGNGTNNWDDFSSADSSATETNTDNNNGAVVKNIMLGGVAIEDTSVIYDNQSNNTHYELTALAMTIGELVYGQPLRVAMSMGLLSRNPQLASNVNVDGTVMYDVDKDLYYLSPLSLKASLSGPDVPAGATVALSTALSMNLDQDTLMLDNLQLDGLGTRITANVNARRIQTSEPAVAANLNIAGSDLAAIFRILEQDDLARRIGALNNTFNITTSIDADMQTGVVTVPALQAALLDANISGQLQAAAMNTDEPSVTGNLQAAGPDLPTLIEVVGMLQGGSDTSLARIGRQLTQASDKGFSVQTSFDANMESGELTIPEFSMAMLGARVSGDVTGSRINTETPALQGKLAAEGPDFPLLMQIAGQLQGGVESSLNLYGERLGVVANRAFTLATDFNADLKEGNVLLPALTAETLGFKLSGSLDAKNMQTNNGSIKGALALTGEDLRAVLTALDQAELAEVAQSLSMNLEVSGSSTNINIEPLSFDFVVAGAQIPNSPQTISLNAETAIDLDDDSINVDNFTLGGLGLSASGNIAASELSGDMSYEGRFTIPEVNLRNILEQLNQELPETADATVLQKFSMGLAFNGTANSFAVEDLAATMDDTTVKGSLAVSDLATMATRFTVDVDNIDADRYLPPSATETPDSVPEQASPIDVAKLQELDVQGAINIGQLTISGLNMSDVAIAMTANGGKLALNPVSASLYDGNFQSDMLLDASSTEPTATVNAMLGSINLEPLLQDFMDATYLTGTGNIQLGLTGHGADMADIKRSINGNGNVSLENGVLTGVDVGAVLGSIETMIRSKRVGTLPQGGKTAFNNFSATLDIQNGIVSSNDLLIEAPGWKVNGAGTLVDLGNDTINYNLVATVEPATANSNDEQFDIGGYSLPIACKGSINSPSCLPDAQQIISAAVTNAVQQRIGDFLQNRLGGGTTQQEASPQNTQPQNDDTQPAEEEPDVEQQLINRALDRLLR